MEDQLTIRLPRELNDALKARAALMQRKPSEVVRIAVAEFLQMPEPGQSRVSRVNDLIGSLASGIPDLATHHRRYLIKKLRSGR